MKEWPQLIKADSARVMERVLGRNKRLFVYCEEAHRDEDEVRKTKLLFVLCAECN
jgi:hypothetical protein